jgi:hypothetical protein
MNKTLLQKATPHAIAVGIFLLVTLIFCKPALESGVVLKQSDVSSWEGMSKQSFEYKEKNGHFPMWVTSMFSGMPAYQIALDGIWSPLGYFDKLFQLWLPKPLNFFFLACLSFYFLCLCLRIRPYAAILGALGFAFCTYSPIIITAGHDTKMLGMAYIPALMGAVILIFDKKYFVGIVLAALFTALQIGQGHQQVSYYAFIILGIMSVFYIANALKAKATNGLVKSLGVVVLAGLMGIAVDAIGIFPTYDYAKYSKRGGQLKMDDAVKADNVVNGKTTGLSKEYAFQWSYGRAETMSLMFPGVKGYGLYYAQREGESYMFPQLKENANVVNYMTEVFPQAPADQIAQQMSQSLYWGDQPFTNGPVYLGAAICFLFILGMFYLDGKHKWWIFTASILAILMALGSNLPGFNNFLFDYVPLYNKFRVPTMTLIIPQVLFPLMAVLVIDKLMTNTDTEAWKKFKLGLIATAAVFALGLGYYVSTDFDNENKARTSAFNKLWETKPTDFQVKYAALNEQYKGQRDNQVYENWVLQLQENKESTTVARGIVTALKKDRSSLLLTDILRSLIIVLLVAGFIAAYLKNKLSAKIMLIGVTVIASIDLLWMGSHYLNAKSFDLKENYTASEFPMTDADRTILADKDPNFRVFNTTVGSPFEESKTSYYHKSIGGYHAAKMGIYDDLSAYQMGSQNPNEGVLNMLNAKWIILEQDKKPIAVQNPNALGNAWFIKAVTYVNGPVAEMKGLTNLNTRDTAVIDESFKSLVGNFAPADSTSSIKQTNFDNEAITYESNTNANHLALFSEIYYKDWQAYIDGKPVPSLKANYVLRALPIPAGKHKIEFKFEPKIYFASRMVSGIASWILFGLVLVAGFLVWRRKGEKLF